VLSDAKNNNNNNNKNKKQNIKKTSTRSPREASKKYKDGHYESIPQTPAHLSLFLTSCRVLLHAYWHAGGVL
jgi:hypothetical protein